MESAVMPVTLPVDGQSDWGDELNTAITTVDTEAVTAQNAINSHAANSPADPHGDRAFSQALVTPLTAGVNKANGFVQLNSSGTIPAGLISGSGGAGGSFTNVFDAVATFGAVPNTGADQSTAIQSALTACATAGGGEVWIGEGVFSLANYLVVGSNTWLHLSQGTTLKRIVGSSTPAYLVTNCLFGTNNTPGTNNIMISGGTLDAVGSGLSSSCTPIFIIQSTKVTIRDMTINTPFNNPAIELNGITTGYVDNVYMTGTGSGFSAATAPALRINSSSASTTPSGLASGLYNNQVCSNISFVNSGTGPTVSAAGTYGSLAATDLAHSGSSHGPIMVLGCYTNYEMFSSDLPTSHWGRSSTAANNFFS
jgi:hypothetical protein